MTNQELVECGICGNYHRRGYSGDCRNDSERFPTPDPERTPDFRLRRHGSFHLMTALNGRARTHLFDVSDPDFLRAVRFWQWPDPSTVIVYPDDVARLACSLADAGFDVEVAD